MKILTAKKLKGLADSSNLDLLWFVIVLIIMNVPLWNRRVWPGDYTLMTFFNFYFVYNDFYLYNEIPHWFPFGAYGVPANYWQFHQLSPPCYFVGILGWILRIKDVLLLFKLSGFMEQLILLIGTYLFTSRLLTTRTARALVCLSVLLSSFWFYENFWNLRLYYLVPLMLYALILFFDRKDSFYFWISGCIFSISLIGNLPYFFSLHFIILLLFFIVLTVKQPSSLLSLLKMSGRAKFAFGTFTLISLTCFYFFANSLDEIYVHKLGRDPNQWYATPLNDFLTLGPGIDWGKFIELVLPNPGERYDTVIYPGLIATFFVFYALLRARSCVLYAVWVVFIYLTLFSVGSQHFTATMTYHIFPPIRLFRYIGQVGSLIKLFVLITAGFGLDHLLKEVNSQSPKKSLAGSLLLTIGITCSFIVYLILEFKIYSNSWLTKYHVVNFLIFTIFSSTLLIGIYKLDFSKKTIGFIVLFTLSLELLLYQFQFIQSTYRTQVKKAGIETPQIFKYQFQTERAMTPEFTEKRIRDAYDLVFSKPGFWMEAYDFVKFDPCLPIEPTIYEPIGLTNLTSSLFGISMKFPVGMYMADFPELSNTPRAKTFFSTLGCYSPKLKLTTNVLMAANDQDAARIISTVEGIDGTPVVSGDIESGSSNVFLSGKTAATIQPVSFRSNELTLNIHPSTHQNLWLYYADSYHRNWKAWVDGKEVVVSKANLAFKIIKLPINSQHVRFKFVPGWKDRLIYVIALIGILFCSILVALFFLLIREKDARLTL